MQRYPVVCLSLVYIYIISMAVAVDNIDMGNEADVAMRANDVKTVVISAVR